MQSGQRGELFQNFRKWYQENRSSLFLRNLLKDTQRNQKLRIRHGDLMVDFSKQNLNEDALQKLEEVYNQLQIKERIQQFFAGEKINSTEGRSVLHPGLRLPKDAQLEVDGQNVVSDVHEVLQRIESFSTQIRGMLDY